jgi:hypothetical protein
MDPLHILVIEQGADWSQWGALSQRLRGAAMILIQQADEPTAMFRRRIERKLRRLKTRVRTLSVLLGAPPRDRITARIRSRLLRDLAGFAQGGLRIYSGAAAAFA